MSEIKHSFYDGKYTVIFEEKGGMRALRHGKEWRDLTGDGMILAMLQEVDDLKQRLAEVYRCSICAKIAISEEISNNLNRIVEISSPNHKGD